MTSPLTAGIFVQAFLSPAMSFVYRPLVKMLAECGGSTRAEAILPHVLAIDRREGDRFPWDGPLTLLGGTHPQERRTERLRRRVAGDWWRLSRGQVDQAAGVLKEARSGLVHAQFGPEGILAVPIAREAKVPLVVSIQGHDGSQLLRDKSYRRRLHATVTLASAVLCASRDLASRLRDAGIKGDHVRVLHDGIDLTPAEVIPPRDVEDDLRLLQVGSLRDSKGYVSSLEAVGLLREEFPLVSYRIIGDGDLRGDLERHARGFGLGDCVEFLGWQTPGEVYESLRWADFFLHPSVTPASGDTEGMPHAIMEAMSMGLPVVATLHGGIPELVEDGVSGVLVDEGDAEGIARRVLEIVRDPVRWRSMGRVAHAMIEQGFDLDQQVAARKTLYREVAAGDPLTIGETL